MKDVIANTISNVLTWKAPLSQPGDGRANGSSERAFATYLCWDGAVEVGRESIPESRSSDCGGTE